MTAKSAVTKNTLADPDEAPELTFAMARHAVVDLSIVFQRGPRETKHDRLPSAELAALRAALKAAGLRLSEGVDTDRKLAELSFIISVLSVLIRQIRFYPCEIAFDFPCLVPALPA